MTTANSDMNQADLYQADQNPQIPQIPQPGGTSADLNTPVFNEYVYQNIPDQLKNLCEAFTESREKDITLLGALTTIGSFINDVFGKYRSEKIYTNLYLFVVAPPSSGKGVLKHCRSLAQPVHDNFRIKPGDKNLSNRMFILPGNNSSTGIYQQLYENDGVGLLIETEGDTLANSFKQDFGDFSSGLRDAFHHEPITYNRRKDNERVEINEPRLSAILSGTPVQVRNLIPSTENGLFSRFIFYTFEAKPTFDDVFKKNVESDLKEHFQQIGSVLFQHYCDPDNLRPGREFVFSQMQQAEFQQYFSDLTFRLTQSFKEGNITAVIRRMGLIFFRIAMILSYLRNLGNNNETIECSSIDFIITKEIIDVLMEHSIVVLDYLPRQDTGKMPLKNKQILDNLPDTFTRQELLGEAERVGVPEKTIEGFISRQIKAGKLTRIAQGTYKKNIP